jgi:biopolymer transport protein ExbB
MSHFSFLSIRRHWVTGATLLLLGTSIASAQDHQGAARARLESSVKELAEVRANIAEQKIPLSSELRELENRVLALRRERERMQRNVDNQSVDLNSLTSQLKGYDDEAGYVGNLLNDYLNRVSASLSVGEVARYSPAILAALNRSEDTGLTTREKIELQLTGVRRALERTTENVGGTRFAGEVVLPGGRVSRGTHALLGPVNYFADEAGNAGIVTRGSSGTPALLVFDPKANPAIAAFIQNGRGPLPLDSTNGRALAIATANETLIEHFMKGGLWMWPILFFGVLAVVITLVKLVDILGVKVPTKETLEPVFALVKARKLPEALHQANTLSGPGGDMIRSGLQNYHLSKELQEEFLFETLLTVKPKLERGITFITLAASVAPLLGLLGTVTGMIETFKLLTLFGTGDAKSLSSGISQALITTEFGLVAAIPALILGAIVGRLVANRLGALEALMITFSNGLAAAKEQDAVDRPSPSAVVAGERSRPDEGTLGATPALA